MYGQQERREELGNFVASDHPRRNLVGSKEEERRVVLSQLVT